MKPVRTWVVVADGAHAKVFEHSKAAKQLKLVRGMTFDTDLPANREILADRPVRSFESQGRARHAKEERTNPHRELKRAFAKKLAAALAEKHAGKRFERLVLVAPPKALGDLRGALTKAVHDTVVGELAHDLVKTPHGELAPHLSKILPLADVARVEKAAPARKARGKTAR